MRALHLRQYGSATDTKIEDVKRPKPKADEVLIKIHAASVNDWDLGLVTGSPFYIRLICGLQKPKVRIPGVDYAGVVEAVGKKVTDINVGDRVYGDLSDKEAFGAFAEYVAAPTSAVCQMPDEMSFEDAAAIPHAATLALQSFDLAGCVQDRKSVLFNGAGGGVGTIGAQLARHFGFTHIAGVDHGDKFDAMKAAGFDDLIDYTTTDFTRLGKKYDLIIDAKTNRPGRKYLNCLTETGAYVTVGGDTSKIFLIALFGKKRGDGKTNQVLALDPNHGMEELNNLYTAGVFRPIIDGPYDFADLPEAIAHFGRAEHKGKIVIKMPNA